MLDWIKQSLLIEQQKPFSRSTRNAVILAAAGSGKTRTLVHLVANDIAKGIPPSDIIVFTFTTKAAEELLARIHLLTTEHFPETSLNGMYIGTIHAWCLKYLIEQSDYYNFTPIDELHIDALISRLYDILEIGGTYGLQYPRAIDRFIADVEIFFNENLTSKQVPVNISSSIERFIKVLRDNRLISFGSMIRYAIEHLVKTGVNRHAIMTHL